MFDHINCCLDTSLRNLQIKELYNELLVQDILLVQYQMENNELKKELVLLKNKTPNKFSTVLKTMFSCKKKE